MRPFKGPARRPTRCVPGLRFAPSSPPADVDARFEALRSTFSADAIGRHDRAETGTADRLEAPLRSLAVPGRSAPRSEVGARKVGARKVARPVARPDMPSIDINKGTSR